MYYEGIFGWDYSGKPVKKKTRKKASKSKKVKKKIILCEAVYYKHYYLKGGVPECVETGKPWKLFLEELCNARAQLYYEEIKLLKTVETERIHYGQKEK